MLSLRNLPIDKIKFWTFVLGGLTVAVLELALKYTMSEGQVTWETRLEHLLLPLPVAWIVLWCAERLARVRFRWLGPGERHVKAFALTFLAWAACTWIISYTVFESVKPIKFVVNVLVVYMWAGAFLELCNLIKVRAK